MRYLPVLICLWIVSTEQISVVPVATVDPFLVTTFGHQKFATVIITMRDRTTGILDSLSSVQFSSREERLDAVTKALQSLARSSQQAVLTVLEMESKSHKIQYETMWITNQIIVRNVSMELVDAIARFPEVATITEEKMAYIDEPIREVYDTFSNTTIEEVQWGVEQIEAPVVWTAGANGSGIVVATIDTGVRFTHEALSSNFRSEYGWYDPGEKTELPNDQNGHGTHTTANIAGTSKGTGVAPGSKWISCKGCATSACSQSDLLACGQFILCPTDSQGRNEDCAKAPHIVSNSWGWGQGGNTLYDDAIHAWRTAGIIPLFSIGNAGPFCGTAHSPGDNPNVIGVGATMDYNEIAVFSSTGPTAINGRIKPDIAAPGYEIVSASSTSDTTYVRMSGTSMACPHAAGAAALILSANPHLNYEQVKGLLEAGSVPTQVTGRNCGGIPEGTYPNHHVGFGRINARLSFLMAGEYK